MPNASTHPSRAALVKVNYFLTLIHKLDSDAVLLPCFYQTQFLNLVMHSRREPSELGLIFIKRYQMVMFSPYEFGQTSSFVLWLEVIIIWAQKKLFRSGATWRLMEKFGRQIMVADLFDITHIKH